MAQSITATDFMNQNSFTDPFEFQIPTPCGSLIVRGSSSYIEQIELLSSEIIGEKSNNLEHPLFQKIQHQLNQYFNGERRIFDLPIKFHGTDFQMKVWNALLEIPCGETMTYGDLAKKIGNPKAQQAVGGAVGANPIPLIIPCHRIVAKGHIGGFSGPMSWKTWLLGHETVKNQ